jgi:hypothetical protein
MFAAHACCLNTNRYREHPFSIIPLHLSPRTVVSAIVVSATSDQVNDEMDSGERDVAATPENSYTCFIQEKKEEKRDRLAHAFLGEHE